MKQFNFENVADDLNKINQHLYGVTPFPVKVPVKKAKSDDLDRLALLKWKLEQKMEQFQKLNLELLAICKEQKDICGRIGHKFDLTESEYCLNCQSEFAPGLDFDEYLS